MLSYEEKGNGLPVVLIHAFPLSGEMWRGEMNKLSKKFRVIVPDMPGFGQSGRLPEPSIAEMANQIFMLLNRIEIRERIFIGGLSMGGYAAFEFFRQFPERVRGLGLFSTRAAADTPGAKEKRMQAIAELRKEGIVPFADKTVMNLLGQSVLDARPELIQQVIALIRKNKAEGIADALLALAGRRDSTELLAKIKCPALILAGDEDKIIPSSEAADMHEKIKGSQFQTIPHAGHLINLESPDEFSRCLEQFLSLL